MKAVAGLLGLGKAPKVSNAPVVDTLAEQKKAKTARAALLSTEGGIAGEELQAGQVSRRDSMFGN